MRRFEAEEHADGGARNARPPFSYNTAMNTREAYRSGVGMSALGAVACVVGGVAVLGGLAGCNAFAMNTISDAEYKRTISTTLPVGDVSSLAVAADNGWIRVEERIGADQIVIRADLQSDSESRLNGATIISVTNAEGLLDVSVNWPGGWSSRWNDSGSLLVTMPVADDIQLDSRNGPISVEGFSGVIAAETLNGAVSIKRHDGPVRVRTTNGPVTIEGLTAAAVVDTSNGAIIVSTENAAGPLDLQTSNGPITLSLDGGFVGTLTAATSNGGVTLNDLDSFGLASVLSTTPRSAVIQFGPDPAPASTVRTSNSNVVIRGR